MFIFIETTNVIITNLYIYPIKTNGRAEILIKIQKYLIMWLISDLCTDVG